MHYTILTDSDELSFEIERNDPGQLLVRHLDDVTVVDARCTNNGRVHLIIDGCSYDVTTHLDGHDVHCSVRGVSHSFRVYNDRDLRMLRLEEASTGGVDLITHSPMAGKVIAVDAVAGASAEKDQPMVVIEAMKMENIIRAPFDGLIESVHVQVGQAVEQGTSLFELVPTE